MGTILMVRLPYLWELGIGNEEHVVKQYIVHYNELNQVLGEVE